MPELGSRSADCCGAATDDAEGGGPAPKRRYLADATKGIARVRAAGQR